MSVDRTIAGVLFDIGAADARTTAYEYADEVIAAIRGMSHDELRQLRPDIAILFDATRDTSNARAAYILALTTRGQTTDGRPVTIHLTIQDDEGGQA